MYYDLAEIAKQYKGASITIFGNGHSVATTDDHKRVFIYDSSAIDEPIWAINGGWHYHKGATLGFDIHDFKADTWVKSDVETKKERDELNNFVDKAGIPIMSVRAHEDHPNLVPLPLQEIIDYAGMAYFGEATNYMVALACMWGVKQITFYGCDYMPSDRPPHERASLEFWCGFAHAKGVKILISTPSQLCKTALHEDMVPGFYGYTKDYLPLRAA